MTKIKDYIRGDSRAISLTVRDAEGDAFNLTGCTVFFTVNATEAPDDDTAAIIEKEVTVHTNPTAGLTTISITNADTQDLTPGSYWYDIQLKDTSGNITSLKKDRFIIISDITRRIT